MLRRALLGWGVLVFAATLWSCGGSTSVGPQDSGPTPCTDDNQCQDGYSCSGGYCQPITRPDAAADAPAPPKMLVSPTLLDFGSPYVGGEYVKTFTIANVGVADLTVASLNLIEDRTNGAYQLTALPLPFVVPGGDQETITVTLRPNDENLPTGSVKIHSDDPDPSTADATVDLVTHVKGSARLGVCVMNPTPPPDCVVSTDLNPLIDYGTIDYGTSAERVVALTNAGDGNLPIEITGVSLTNAAHFILTLFALVDDPANPGQKIEEATSLPFFLSIGDPTASPPVPTTELRVHVKFEAVGIDGDVPHESLVVEYSLTGSPTTIPIVGRIKGCQPNGSDAGVPDGGADPQTDPYNCGACGVRCDATVKHATVTCSAGVCDYSSCDPNWGDCDVDYQNGCETDLRVTTDHCGACDSPCTNAHATGSVCAGSTCTAPNCDTSWGNCDGDNKNGCETDLRVTTEHCGTCATACTTPPGNGTTRCLNSMCTPTCVPNRSKDCDGDPVNGCETNIGTDVYNCGDCNVICDNSGGSVSCVGGVCKPGCNPGFGDCDGNPVNGCETNILTNADNCGGCGASYRCSSNNMSTRVCVGGLCSGQCAPSYADCNNNKQTDGCEVNTLTDPDNCGGCGTVCSGNNMQTRTCVGGVCSGQCAAGFADCNGNKQIDGCEINTQTDPDNCGGCGSSFQCSGINIPSRTCTAGLCSGTCATGFGDCNGNKLTDGCEVNLNTSTGNCGNCGRGCSNSNVSSLACSGGLCTSTCNAGYANCAQPVAPAADDGCEANLNTNPDNCGQCGRSCSGTNVATLSCSAGLCNSACNAGFGNCNQPTAPTADDGCEVNTNSSTANCGGCSRACATTNTASVSCNAGLCNSTCNAGFV
ncbi:MAG: choice-of-anchor D domain-containing protein, partial [Deltaproteobacteria bacterium]|nr:choice-of-anchor D domain-containing protein [Deltaproteobacteria bacterium]